MITVLPDRGLAGSQILVTRQLVRKLLYYAWAGWRTALCGLVAAWHARSHAVVEDAHTGDFAAARGVPVTTITGPVDTRRYLSSPRAARATVGLGWIGSATTLAYLDLIREPLSRLGARFPGARLCVIGAPGYGVADLSVKARPWALDREMADLQGFDIGLMPIPDDPWTRGKGGYKLLQDMATAIPVVTSPVVVNREVVRHGVDGYWAETPEQWEERLARLIADRALRERLGHQGRRRMESVYARDQAVERLLPDLASMVREARR